MLKSKPSVFNYSPNPILPNNGIVMLSECANDLTILMAWMQKVLNVSIETNNDERELQHLRVSRLNIDVELHFT